MTEHEHRLVFQACWTAAVAIHSARAWPMHESQYRSMPIWMLRPDIARLAQLGSSFVPLPSPSSAAVLGTERYTAHVCGRPDRSCLSQLVPLQPQFEADGRYCATLYHTAVDTIESASYSMDDPRAIAIVSWPTPMPRLRISRQ